MRNMTIIWIFLSAVMMPIASLAGSLDSPGPPSSGSGMLTLTDIYNRLDTGATITVPGTFQEPSSGPTAGTGKSLSDIQSKLPAIDNTNGATAAGVLSGKTFWGLTNGQWGKQTGTRKRPWGCDGDNGAFYFNCIDDCISDVGQDTGDCDLVCSELDSYIIIKGILTEYCAR